MDLNNVLNIQHQIKENSEELQKYLLDLESWEKEMKQKEKELKLIETIPEEVYFLILFIESTSADY